MNNVKFILILFLIFFIFYLIYLSFQNRFNLESLFKLDFFKKDNRNIFSSFFILDHLKPQTFLKNYTTTTYITKNVEKLPVKKKELLIKNNTTSKLEKKFENKEIIPPLGFEKKDLSPFYQKISFVFNRNYDYNSIQSFISIIIYNKELENVNITNWYFKTNKGLLFVIPKGIKDFKINSFIEYSDIILKKNDEAEIYWGYNQTGIKNFNIKFNKCIGYLNNIYKFSPPLPRNCPEIKFSDFYLLSGKCQDFLKKIPKCYQPTNKDIYEFALDFNCFKYFDKFNYLNCYESHKNDSDFFQNIWRVYLKPDTEIFDFNLDKLHDRIMLFDQNNLLVNIFSF